MASAPTKPWKSPYITTWENFRNPKSPMNFADEAYLERQLRLRTADAAKQP
jgi:hypothetical protein